MGSILDVAWTSVVSHAAFLLSWNSEITRHYLAWSSPSFTVLLLCIDDRLRFLEEGKVTRLFVRLLWRKIDWYGISLTGSTIQFAERASCRVYFKHHRRLPARWEYPQKSENFDLVQGNQNATWHAVYSTASDYTSILHFAAWRDARASVQAHCKAAHILYCIDKINR